MCRWKACTARCRCPTTRPASGGRWRAFVGPALLVSVGYMDPGNWGTDLQGGAQFKYGLLWVVGLASLMAIFLQVIAARLGVVTGKDLAQCCRDWYPALDALAQLAAVRTGHRRLRSGRGAGQRRGPEPAVPHPAVLGGHHHRRSTCCCCWPCSASGMRTIEAVVAAAVATIGVCYFIEIFVLPQTQPSFRGDGAGAVLPRAFGRRG